MTESFEDHMKKIKEKQAKSLKIYEEQMINGKIFGNIPFEKLDDLKESFSDFDKPTSLKTNINSIQQTKKSEDDST